MSVLYVSNTNCMYRSIETSLVKILSASFRLKHVLLAHVKALAVSCCVLLILAAQHLLLRDQKRHKLNFYCIVTGRCYTTDGFLPMSYPR
jgi:hypothetical protein